MKAHSRIRRTMVVFAVFATTVGVITVLSCGPAAPSGGDGETLPTEDKRPPPQTREQATPVPEASPTPEATPKLLSRAAMTMYRLTEEANRSAAGGSGTSDSGGAVQLPTTMRIFINVLPREPEMEGLKQFLSDNGATNMARTSRWGLEADIPPLLFGAVTRHPGYLSSFTSGLYGDKMDGILDETITMYVAGELASHQAATCIWGYVLYAKHFELVPGLEVRLAAASDQAAVQKYITNNDGYVGQIKSVDAVVLEASVPVSAFPGLYALSEVVSIKRPPSPQGEPQPDPRNSPGSSVPPASDPIRPLGQAAL